MKTPYKEITLFSLILLIFLSISCKKTEVIEEPDPNNNNNNNNNNNITQSCNEAPNPKPRSWVVATNGSDAGAGTVASPLKSIQKAVDSALQGDTILLRGGTHESKEIKVRISKLTFRSYPNEWAVVKAVTNVEDITSCFWYREPCINGGLIENLEIVGGYLYGIKLEDNWDWNEPVLQAVSNLTIRNCKIHDTGRDCIKIVPGCANIQVLNCEIYRSGIGPANVRSQNAEGIDNVNGPNMIVRNCYFHDISTNGLYAKGGAKNCIIENNLFINCGEMGICAGNTDTDEEWFDKSNTEYIESFDIIIRNNIIVNAKWGGVGLFAAVRSQVMNNTFINVASETYGALYISRGETYVGNNGRLVTPPCKDLKIMNNIFVQSTSGDRSMIRIRYNSGDKAESLTGTNIIDYNCYFRSGNIAVYENRQQYDLTFAQWKASTGFDAHSFEANPLLNAQYHLSNGSPCIKKGLQQGIISIDYDGNARSGNPDIGADELGGTALQTPPPSGVIGTK